MLKKEHVSLAILQRNRLMEFVGYCNKLERSLSLSEAEGFLGMAQENLEKWLKPLPEFTQSEVKEDALTEETIQIFGYRKLDPVATMSLAGRDPAAKYYRNFEVLFRQVIFRAALSSYVRETGNSDILAYFKSEYDDSPTWLVTAFEDYVDYDTATSVFPALRLSLSAVYVAVSSIITEGPGATKFKVIRHLLGYTSYQPGA